MIATPAVPLLPAEAARRAARSAGAFWLCGPIGDGAAVGRHFVGTGPVRVVRARTADDVHALVELEEAWAEARSGWGGAAGPAAVPVGVGWLSYDLGRRLVGLAARSDAHALSDADRAAWPALEFGFHEAVWVSDGGGAATIFARDSAAARRLAAVLEGNADPEAPSAAIGPLVPDHPDGVFLAGARRILDYLVAGDVYQVNLARRLSAPILAGSAVDLAVALAKAAPAAHAAFIAAADGSGALLGNSPERFLAVDPEGRVETAPIKGTRPRAADPEGDRAATAALLASTKDRAEHVMIVDLERNDLGRVCQTGTVEVASLARLLSLPTVHHLVSTVRGVLQPGIGLGALLSATFPGGSITGAPKLRAMQIIDELEPVARGPYTGATGWLGAAGDLDLAIAIRTALVRRGRLSVSVGSGIVADSEPEAELAETEAKARAFSALGPAGL